MSLHHYQFLFFNKKYKTSTNSKIKILLSWVSLLAIYKMPNSLFKMCLQGHHVICVYHLGWDIDTITQSHVFDILDTNLPSWAFWILLNSSTAIWGQRAVNKFLIYFFLILLGSYFQPFCELTPLGVVEDHKQTPKTAGNQV